MRSLDQPSPAPGDDAPDALDPATAALAAAALEISRHLQDAPRSSALRWFTLARTARLLREHPGTAALLGLEAQASAAVDDLHLTSVEMDHLEPTADLQEGLAALRWPDFAAGGAVAIDLEPAQWRALDSQDSPARAAQHGVRVVVAADSDGMTWTVLRFEGGAAMRMGRALLPGVSAALGDSLGAR